MALHKFRLHADWPGGRNEVGTIDAGNLKTKISIPKEMDGPGVGTNPDEMLLGAASTCYIITVAAMIERSSIPIKHLSLDSTGDVDVTKGVYTYKKITHKPVVKLQAKATETDLAKVKEIVHAAESSCMISRAIKGNVEVVVEENITIEAQD